MKSNHNILLGLPPHNFDLYHPLHTRFGIFFHIKKRGEFDNNYESIFDWLKNKNIIKLSSVQDLLNFLSNLNDQSKHEINLAVFSKREFLTRKEVDDILLIVENYSKNKNIIINLKTDINNFETFYSKLDFYKFCENLNYQNMILKYSSLSNKSRKSIKFPLLIRNAISSGGKDTYLIKNNISFNLIYIYISLKKIFQKTKKADWFVQEFIDTKIKFGYYRSYRVLAFNKKPYFIYPNISKTNPITHVSEKDKLSKEDFLESVRFGIDIFNNNKDQLEKIFEGLGNPFAALDLVSLDSDRIFITEAELKYGPSEKYIDNQIRHFNLDNDFFDYIRDELKTKHLSFDDIINIFE